MTSRSERRARLLERAGACGRLFVRSAAFLALYVAVDAATYVLPAAPFAATPWNPHPALAVALVALGGAAYVPAVFAAVLVAEYVVRDAPGTPLGTLLACGGMAASYVGTALALRHMVREPWAEAGVREVVWFIGVSAVGTLAAAALYVGGYLTDDTLEADEALRVFGHLWLGDALGLTVLTPLLLLAAGGALGQWRALAPAQRRAAVRDTVLLVAALAALLAIVFGVKPFDELRMSYLVFLPMIGFALRYGLAGAAIGLPCAQLGFVLSLAITQTLSTSAVEFQLLMLTLAVTTLVLGALASERHRSLAALAARERELRDQQATLAQAQRTAAAAELAAALAHELNQPLSAIGTYASACRVLAQDGAQQSQLLQALARVTEESARAGEFVRRMRDFFKSGAAHVEPVAIAELLAAAHDQVADRLTRARIAWRVQIEPGLPRVPLDRVQIGAVLGNLLNNAIDALLAVPPPRAIEVRARRVAGGAVRIEVCDSGPGVPAEVRDRLFQPMATSKPEGMGLGLAIGRTIAERHGGRLWLDTEARLTTFCLELPTEAMP
ncbi:MAG: ATP-binding protein [Burkholderiaceae bacterium]|nr:ATP-binding protein [Burkholderiaceae bacterium]